MASFQKTAKGWRVQLDVKGKRESRTFPNKASAQEWADRRQAELRSIQAGHGSKTHTVGNVLDDYQQKISPTKRGERWEKLRLDLIGRVEIDGRLFRDIRLADLKATHIAAWRDARLRGTAERPGVSGASVSREMSLLSDALEVARKEWAWLTHDPMKDVRRPPDNPPRDRLITDYEIERITLALGYQEGMPVSRSSQRVAVAFLLAIDTAMRSGEILGLTSDLVDMEKRVAHLPATITKNGCSRDVPLSTRAVELLKMLPTVEEGQPLFALAAASRDALFRKAKEKAGITDLTFHDTRHEAITRLAKKLQPLDLARMTGHTNLQELLTYYNETAESIAQRLG